MNRSDQLWKLNLYVTPSDNIAMDGHLCTNSFAFNGNSCSFPNLHGVATSLVLYMCGLCRSTRYWDIAPMNIWAHLSTSIYESGDAIPMVEIANQLPCSVCYPRTRQVLVFYSQVETKHA